MATPRGTDPASKPDPKKVENENDTSVDTSSPESSSSPHLPNERDESTGMTGGIQSDTVKQGHTDVKRGLEDTSRAPEADKAYKNLKK